MSELLNAIKEVAKRTNPVGIEVGTMKGKGLEVGGTSIKQDIASAPNSFDSTKLPDFEPLTAIALLSDIPEHPEFAQFARQVVNFSEKTVELSQKIVELKDFLEKYLKRERIGSGDQILTVRINEENFVLGKVKGL